LEEHRSALAPEGRRELYTFWVNQLAFQRGAGFRMDFTALGTSRMVTLVRPARVLELEVRGQASSRRIDIIIGAAEF
jgi:exonuclease III